MAKVGFGTAIGSLLGTVVHSANAVGKLAETADVLADIGLTKAKNMHEVVKYEDALTMLELQAESAERAAKLKAAGLPVDDIELG
jgi:hypothetical protein